MKALDAALEQKLRSNLDAKVRVIVRTNGDPNQYTQTLQSQGFHVVRTSSLINAVTVDGTAKLALALGGADWVARIEEDKPVHTM